MWLCIGQCSAGREKENIAELWQGEAYGGQQGQQGNVALAVRRKTLQNCGKGRPMEASKGNNCEPHTCPDQYECHESRPTPQKRFAPLHAQGTAVLPLCSMSGCHTSGIIPLFPHTSTPGAGAPEAKHLAVAVEGQAAHGDEQQQQQGAHQAAQPALGALVHGGQLRRGMNKRLM